MVTELGRQPWVIYGVMRTRDAVTPMPGLVVPFTVFTLVYLFLSVILVFRTSPFRCNCSPATFLRVRSRDCNP